MTIQLSSPNASTHGSPQSDVTKADRATYLASLVDGRQGLSLEDASPDLAASIQDIREGAAHEVRSLSLPSTRDEEWRFTDLSPLLSLRFQAPAETDITLDDLDGFLLPEASKSRLVFVNGRYAPELSSTDDVDEGILVSDITHADALPHLTSYLDKQEGLERTFTTLNTASFVDVAVVSVDKNVVGRSPIHLLFVSTTSDTPTISHPRCLVVAGHNSELTLIEDYVSLGDGVHFTNGVTEIWAEENARLTHARLQRDRPSSFHMGKTAVSQAKSSSYTCHTVSTGAQLSRHNLEVFQIGEDTETVLNGLTLISGKQLSDTHCLINYTKPHGTSRHLHKTIVDDAAHAVFNGKVNVPKPAQLTDAAQLNRNLLLSAKGRVDTKPQLEIVADNVKCTHGATVSQLDADEVFYLQSRGIDADRAQTLLIYAFAAEIIQQLPVASLRETWSRFVETLTGATPLNS